MGCRPTLARSIAAQPIGPEQARDFADAVLRLIGTVRPLLTDASRVSWEQTERVYRDLAA